MTTEAQQESLLTQFFNKTDEYMALFTKLQADAPSVAGTPMEAELKTILDLYAKMVSEGSWKDYGLNISNRQVGFSVFKNATENAMYKICKNFKPNNKNLTYLITDSRGKILKNSHDLVILIKNTNWKKL